MLSWRKDIWKGVQNEAEGANKYIDTFCCLIVLYSRLADNMS